MHLDPELVQWVIIGGATLCAFMIGREWGNKDKNDLIEDTITYLCEEGFIKFNKRADGEIEIIRIDEK